MDGGGLVRKADVFCADCGKGTVRSNQSRPQGMYRCIACRRNSRSYEVANPRRTPNRVYARSPWVLAIEADDAMAIRDALIENTNTDGDCLIWRRQHSTVDSYASTKVKGRTLLIHRVMAEAVYGPLGGMSVHHKCARQSCIRPDHLQPVSQRENIAEMLQRNGYLRQIAALREALSALQPDHPLLGQLTDRMVGV